MPFKFRDVRKNLKKKGFVEDKTGDHIYLRHVENGRRTGAYTKVSHGKNADDVGSGIVRSMKDQLQLPSLQHVHKLVKCTINGQQYLDLIAQQDEASPGVD